jgi:hypothetical protein
MLQRAIAAVVVARLVVAPWAGAEEPSPRSGAIAASAAREALRAAGPARRGPMPAGLKWTGIGLLIGAGLPVSLARFADCIPDDFSCRDQRHAAYAAAGVMAGTGALLLVIAHARRSPAMPAIVLRDGRAVIEQRITF